MKNQINRKESSEDAVSPVIGVILMVAITVILAAVIGTFVLGLGEEVGDTPQAGFDISDDGDNVTINLISGQRLDAWNVSGVDSGTGNLWFNGDGTSLWANSSTVGYVTTDNVVMVNRSRVGDTLKFHYGTNGADVSGDQLSVIGVYQNEEAVLQDHVLGD